MFPSLTAVAKEADTQFSTKNPIVEHDWERDPKSLLTDSEQVDTLRSDCRETAYTGMSHPVVPGGWSAIRTLSGQLGDGKSACRELGASVHR